MSDLSNLARAMAQDYREPDSIGPTLLEFAEKMEAQDREIDRLRAKLDKLLHDAQGNGFIGDNLDDAIAWATRQMGESFRLQEEIATLRPTGLSRVWDDYTATVQIVTKFWEHGSLEDRVRAMADDRERLQAIEAEYNACRDTVVAVERRESEMARQYREQRDRLQAIVGRLPKNDS